MSLKCLGNNRGTKLTFYENANLVKVQMYTIDYQQDRFPFYESFYLLLQKV